MSVLTLSGLTKVAGQRDLLKTWSGRRNSVPTKLNLLACQPYYSIPTPLQYCHWPLYLPHDIATDPILTYPPILPWLYTYLPTPNIATDPIPTYLPPVLPLTLYLPTYPQYCHQPYLLPTILPPTLYLPTYPQYCHWPYTYLPTHNIVTNPTSYPQYCH